jgi:hypothetical protein
MKKEIENKVQQAGEEKTAGNITRKEAIKKSGYIAISAATMLMLLNNPMKSHAASGDPVAPASAPQSSPPDSPWKHR